jgi:hypothetical protein
MVNIPLGTFIKIVNIIKELIDDITLFLKGISTLIIMNLLICMKDNLSMVKEKDLGDYSILMVSIMKDFGDKTKKRV